MSPESASSWERLSTKARKSWEGFTIFFPLRSESLLIELSPGTTSAPHTGHRATPPSAIPFEDGRPLPECGARCGRPHRRCGAQMQISAAQQQCPSRPLPHAEFLHRENLLEFRGHKKDCAEFFLPSAACSPLWHTVPIRRVVPERSLPTIKKGAELMALSGSTPSSTRTSGKQYAAPACAGSARDNDAPELPGSCSNLALRRTLTPLPSFSFQSFSSL